MKAPEINRETAPLYPLSATQRLGYLDFVESLVCRKDSTTANGKHTFKAGIAYGISVETVEVVKQKTKLNLKGEPENVEQRGMELSVLVKSEPTRVAAFYNRKMMEDSKVEVESMLEADGSLQDLVDIFEIPHVPDVAEICPAEYQHNLELLDKIVEAMNT